MKSKIFNRNIWCLLSVFFTILFVVVMIGGSIANANSAAVNTVLGINAYEIVTNEDDKTDTEWYKSDFKGDDYAMRANSVKISEEVASDGSVLLWNNSALPLSAGSKISLFGVAQNAFSGTQTSNASYFFSGHGSGGVYIAPSKSYKASKTYKEALERSTENGGPGFTINQKLWNAYSRLPRASQSTTANTGKYGWARPVGMATGNSTYGSDTRWREYAVNEAPWSAINGTSEGDITSSLTDCDAAVMTITRGGGEDGDTWFNIAECLDNSYLDLSREEKALLDKLHDLKVAGTIKKIILVLNTGTFMQMKNIKNLDIDACFWAGEGGTVSFDAIANILSGETNPSGKLPDTVPMDADSAPATENFGHFAYSKYSQSAPATDITKQYHNTYGVYQEGIYVGYLYYETRYEDAILARGSAGGTKGVTAGSGSWKYSDEVAYPFGYGESYTTFEYTSFNVTQKGNDYEAAVTVKNTGSKAGKTAVQIYVQKPYTEYDKQNGIEKAAVELAGFTKTDILTAGQSKEYKITVSESALKSYDAYNKKTYILEKGDYFIAAGSDAHDALNNILAKKGATGMTDSKGNAVAGKASLVYMKNIAADNFTKYAVSEYTGNAVTNRFDDADINLYAGTADQKITYLSRKNWNGTYPAPVSMSCVNATFARDLGFGSDPVANPADVMPVVGRVTSEFGELTLAMLMELEYDDPLWEHLLNQLTFKEMNWLTTYGYMVMAGAESVAAPGALANDGPAGIRLRTNQEPVADDIFAFPNPTIMAATWDTALVEELGVAFAHECIHLDTEIIYAPGANMHRSLYGGRNWEYYSEDPFISGKILGAEVRGLQSKGIMVCIKHFALNEQEKNRGGMATWANEQTIREIYLKAFEIGIVDGKANGIMTSLNRIGAIWVGRHKGLLTDVLRGEWDFIGFVETDSASSFPHMNDRAARAEGIIAGNDMWMLGGLDGAFDRYANNATFVKALRQASKRILYTQLHSIAMNGISKDTRIIKTTAWWQAVILAAQIAAGIIAAGCIGMTVASFIIYSKKKRAAA